MATGSYPVPYMAPVAPAAGTDSKFLMNQLRQLASNLQGLADMQPQEATAAPSKPQIGMVRFAMSPWRPVSGQQNNSWVVYGPSGWTFMQGS